MGLWESTGQGLSKRATEAGRLTSEELIDSTGSPSESRRTAEACRVSAVRMPFRYLTGHSSPHGRPTAMTVADADRATQLCAACFPILGRNLAQAQTKRSGPLYQSFGFPRHTPGYAERHWRPRSASEWPHPRFPTVVCPKWRVELHKRACSSAASAPIPVSHSRAASRPPPPCPG